MQFTHEEGVFKIKLTKGIIPTPDNNRSDILDCKQVKEMPLDELSYLKSVLPPGSVSCLRVDFEIKIKTLSKSATTMYRHISAQMDSIHGERIIIINVDLDKSEGRKKILQ